MRLQHLYLGSKVSNGNREFIPSPVTAQEPDSFIRARHRQDSKKTWTRRGSVTLRVFR